ncbi:MAG TPA: hypothetical protein GX708_08230 [Gallicola sp.]|nr:hypothetical protein [Gallicola sp.]
MIKMNQDLNNLNQDNFNTQGNNEIPNNQPLNNQNLNQGMGANSQSINPQPQLTPSFQQPIMQEPTSQPMNTFESGNTNNQNLNSKPPKKFNLGLIIGIAVAVAVVVVGIVFGSKLLSNKQEDYNLFQIIEKGNLRDSFATYNIESERLGSFKYIGKYKMYADYGYRLYVPTIINATKAINSNGDVNIETEQISLKYILVEDSINDLWVQTAEDNYKSAAIKSDTKEENNFIGYSYLDGDNYHIIIRKTNMDNLVSDEQLEMLITLIFNKENYELIRKIIYEYSEAIGYDINKLIEKTIPKNNENSSNGNIGKEENESNTNEKVYGGKIRVQHGNWYTLFDVPTKYIVNHAYPNQSESGYSYIDKYGYRALESTGSLSLDTDNYKYGESGINVYISFGELDADKPTKKAEILQDSIKYSKENYPDTYETTDAITKTINGKTVVYYIERNHPYDKCSKVTGYMFFNKNQLDKWKNENKMTFYISISYTNYDNPQETMDNLYSAFEEIVNSYEGNYYHSYGTENAEYTIEK